MDAVVLAGGYATRLWPITKHRPKMFLPIGDETVIDRVFAELEADDRISQVYVSTNARFADEFRDHLSTSPFEKPVLSVEDTTEEEEKLGVVGALAQLVDREGISDDLLVIAGDNLFSFQIANFLDFFEGRNAPCLAAYDVGSLDRAKEYGVVELDDDEVTDFQEKPDRPASTKVSIACYAFPADELAALDAYLEGENNPDEPGWFLAWLQARQPVYAFSFDGAWYDIGTPDSYLEAVAWYLDGESYVESGAEVTGSNIGQNVHVMSGAAVRDADIEESVIFGDAVVSSCELRRCIIDEETEINGIDLNGALIGAHTQITTDE